MGKRKWRRVCLADLASAETQREIIGLIDRAAQVPGPQAADGECCGCLECSCGKTEPLRAPRTGDKASP